MLLPVMCLYPRQASQKLSHHLSRAQFWKSKFQVMPSSVGEPNDNQYPHPAISKMVTCLRNVLTSSKRHMNSPIICPGASSGMQDDRRCCQLSHSSLIEFVRSPSACIWRKQPSHSVPRVKFGGTMKSIIQSLC